jgi:ATP-binding cassette subfamily C (CFTR/MRP) protein 1
MLTRIYSLAASLGSLDRIQSFLLLPSREDERSIEEHDLPPRSPRTYTDDQPPQEPLFDITPSICIDRVTVKPSAEATHALSNINLEAKASTITMIAGPIGSGKTTLLKAILGELHFTGNINLSSKQIGYCAQTPWLQNGSIRQNITGFSDDLRLDEDWLHMVMHACALDQDIALLPNGVDTLVGSRGVTLSGGQKHRVALARAVYQRLTIVLLDDVLSALDSNTEIQIVNRLFGSTGLFRKLGTTVILTTHATQHFHLADQIVVLGIDGKVTQRGSYDMLRSQEGYIGSLLLNTVKDSTETGALAPKAVTKVIKASPTPTVEDQTRKTGDLAVYAYWFKSMNLWSVAGFIISTAIYSAFRSLTQYWLKLWTEDNTNMGKYATVYAALSTTALLFEAVTISWVLVRIGPQISVKLHHILLQTVMHAPLSFFAATETGTTLSRFSQDTNLIDRVLPVSAMNVIIRLFRLIGQGVLLFTAQIYMTTTVPLCIMIIYIIQRIYLATSRQMRLLGLESRSPLYSQFIETCEYCFLPIPCSKFSEMSHKYLISPGQRLTCCSRRSGNYPGFPLGIPVNCYEQRAT